MRWLLLWIALTSASAAQPGTRDFNPDDFVPMLGRPWSEVKTYITPPDSGQVVGKSGTLVWQGDAHDVSEIRLTVRDGILSELTAAAAPLAYDDYAAMAEGVRTTLGPPGADGYYTAEQVRSLGQLNGARVDLRFDLEAKSLTLRAPRRDQR